jgi:hypothetical protein
MRRFKPVVVARKLLATEWRKEGHVVVDFSRRASQHHRIVYKRNFLVATKVVTCRRSGLLNLKNEISTKVATVLLLRRDKYTYFYCNNPYLLLE